MAFAQFRLLFGKALASGGGGGVPVEVFERSETARITASDTVARCFANERSRLFLQPSLSSLPKMSLGDGQWQLLLVRGRRLRNGPGEEQ